MRRPHARSAIRAGLAGIFLLACTGSHGSELPTSANAAPSTALRDAIAGPQRSEQERARDTYRHPLETLTFFGVRDDMTVVELWPGRGWYSSILAPYLRDRGKLVVASGDPNGEPKAEPTEDGAAFLKRRSEQPEAFDRVSTLVVPPEGEIVLGPPE